MIFNIIKVESTDSTNEYAQNLISRKELMEGDVVCTEKQMNGKGQGQNFWESEHSSNLTCSIILEPKFLLPTNQFALTQIVSLAILDVINGYLGINKKDKLKVKWPNDIYIGHQKVAGILFQNFIIGNKIDYSIVGIGVNINQLMFLSDAKNPVSLIHHTKKVIAVSGFLNSLLVAIGKRYELFKKDSDFDGLKSSYMKNLYLSETWSLYADKDGPFEGKIIDIDEFGRLKIITRTGKKKIYMFKEVEFVM